jgi:hypothetical protein
MNAAPLQPVLSRRAFIFGISALAGGLVLGTPAAFAQAAAQAPTPTLSAIDIRSVCECEAAREHLPKRRGGKGLVT